MTTAAGVTILGSLAQRWCALDRAEVPGEAAAVARHCVLDWFGCALAGSREPLARILRDTLAPSGPAGVPGPDERDKPGGPSTLLGVDRHADTRTAALINGASGHALDFDDTHTLLSGHPTAPVLPAVLAVAEARDASAAEVTTALVAGIEVECRVAALVAPAHYRVGWHATGTLGTIGAAAAVAHLLGLDTRRATQALALAATQAAGLKASFGSMAKPLHAGKAATDGLLAAQLAAGGFTGNPAVLEASQGLAEAAGGTVIDPERLERWADRWTIRNTLFKYHAACYLTHASINAALALREALMAQRIDVGDIETVEVRVAGESMKVCAIEEPTTGLEGKFSLRATAAMALLGDDTTDLAAYTDSRMRHPDLVAMRNRVTVVPDETRVDTRSQVIVRTRSGSEFEADDDTGRPATDLDVQWQRLSSKFLGLATPVVGCDRAQRLHAAIAELDSQTSIRNLLRLTHAPA